jgi:hypothetical protein
VNENNMRPFCTSFYSLVGSFLFSFFKMRLSQAIVTQPAVNTSVRKYPRHCIAVASFSATVTFYATRLCKASSTEGATIAL